MKILALAALGLLFVSSAGCAQIPRSGQALTAAQSLATRTRAAVAIGRDGVDPNRRCSNENLTLEYRDCVNASTRDPNVKVRLG